MRRTLAIAGLSILGAALTVAVAAGPLMSRVETPEYTVERSDGAFELRTYPPLTVATVTRPGTRSDAVNRGFRTLAGYIFGGNDQAAKIAMTAPVLQSRGDAHTTAGETSWTIRFVMPRAWTKADLPVPKDGSVVLETVPAASFAVIRFSGFWRDARLAQKTADLRTWLSRAGIAAHGAPVYAFYDPPWTLPMFRRNEIMLAVDAPQDGRRE